MKIVLTFLFCLSTMIGVAQKYITKSGFTEFKASVEAFEPVEATNNSSTAVLNSETGEVAALMFIKAFKFDIALMEEHFNENYMDSNTYPKATFKGKISDFNIDNVTEKEKEFEIEGKLTIRGKEAPINTTATLKKKNDTIYVISTFSVKPGEFDIEIPSIVSSKISEKINISLNYELAKK